MLETMLIIIMILCIYVYNIIYIVIVSKIYVLGDNSVSLRWIWTKLRGCVSYKPPRVAYTAQGPQERPEIIF